MPCACFDVAAAVSEIDGVCNSQRFLLKVRQIQPTYGKARRVTDRYCQCPRLRISFLQGTRRRTWPLRAMYLRPIAPITSASSAAKNCSAQSPKMAFHISDTHTVQRANYRHTMRYAQPPGTSFWKAGSSKRRLPARGRARAAFGASSSSGPTP